MTAPLEAVVRAAPDFDVIHCYTDWVHLPLMCRLGVPHLTTLHGRLDLDYVQRTIDYFGAANFVSISNDQRIPLAGVNWLGTVYHGLPARPFAGYLAFLANGFIVDSEAEACAR